MKRKIYWKDIGQALTTSKGRFLSIFSLMMLGALALTGLKVTAPNMERTAQAYLQEHQTMDLAVLSGLGISRDDIKELKSVEGARVEAGYFKDVTLEKDQAVRLFSASPTISGYQLLEGNFPKQKDEIALSPSLQSSFKIGDRIDMTEPDKGGTILTQNQFKVVGFVASSEILDNTTMGLASSGNGQLAGYGLVMEEAFDSDVYTIARIRYDDLAGLDYASPAYEDKLEQHQEDLEKLLSDNDELRLASIQSEGQEEIAKGEQNISKAKADLEKAEQDLQSGKEQLETGRSEFARGRAKIIQSEAELQAAYDQLMVSKAQLEASKAELDADLEKLDPNAADYDTAYQTYMSGYSLYQAKLGEYEAGLASFNEWNAQHQAGLAQYQAGLAQYEQGLAAYQAGFADYEWGASLLESSSLTLNQEALRLNQADQDLNQVQAELSNKKADATKDIKEAEDELAHAKEDLTKLEKSPYQVFTRSSLPGGDGYTTYSNATRSIAAVGNVFPVVLYLVAALVTFTTMARFVDEERSQSGLFKALGYTNRQIMTKFILYGLGAGLLGTLVGILAGNFVLSPMISDIITKTTVIGPAKLHFYPLWTLLALVLSLISSVLPAYLVVHRELKEKPAHLLLPKPPAAGSKILLEKWQAVWSRLSFTHKVTARNIFRYKLRMLMTIFGVAGTVALLFGGLGIRSSISGVVDRQFGDLLHYDLLVVENGRASEEDLDKLTAFLQSNQVRQSLPIAFEQTNQTLQIGDVRKKLSVGIYVTDREDIGNLVSLENKAGQSIQLSGRGIVLTEKLAQLYGVRRGDKLKMTLEDEQVTVRVADVAEMYAGHFIYMTDAYYEQVTGKRRTANGYLVQLKRGQVDQVQDTASQLLAMPGVKSLVQNTSLMNMLTAMAGSLQSVMTILVVLSILLGLVILYNLTIINMSERIRELSTIRVLGFHNKEVTMYIYRETIALSLIGVLVGLVSGFYLHRLLLAMIGSDSIRFNPHVGAEVYIIPVLAIVGILAGLGWYVNHQLRKVDMLEALKSVE
ncbi:FtsX-like permease family protein [Streptococcus suis]|nr:FtsX-like permease family protein [Streptococcus suis]